MHEDCRVTCLGRYNANGAYNIRKRTPSVGAGRKRKRSCRSPYRSTGGELRRTRVHSRLRWRTYAPPKLKHPHILKCSETSKTTPDHKSATLYIPPYVSLRLPKSCPTAAMVISAVACKIPRLSLRGVASRTHVRTGFHINKATTKCSLQTVVRGCPDIF